MWKKLLFPALASLAMFSVQVTIAAEKAKEVELEVRGMT
jgi:hypothetical protein